MEKKRFILVLLFCLTHFSICAQKKIYVGAVNETDTHIWKLDTIWINNQSSSISFTVTEKSPNVELITNGINRLIDCDTGIYYDAINVYQLNNKTFEPFSPKTVIMTFPGLPSTSSTYSFYSSPFFFVDSIRLCSTSDLLWRKYKYQVPILNHAKLQTHQDSIKYADELFERGLNLFNQNKYKEAIWAFEKLYAFEKLLYYSFTEEMIKMSCTNDWIAYCYYMIDEIDSAKKFNDRDFFVIPYDKRKTKEADSLRYEAYKGHFKQSSIALYKKICELVSDSLGNQSYRYIESLYELGDNYYIIGQYDNAKDIFGEALRILEKDYRKDLYLYEDIYESLAYVATAEDNFYLAARYMEQWLMVRKDTAQIIDDYYLSGYDHLVEVYANAGLWEKAIKIQKLKTNYWKDKYENGPFDVPFTNYEFELYVNLSRYIQLLQLSNKHKLAIRELEYLMRNGKEVDKNKNYFLELLADSFFELNDYKKAEMYYRAIGSKLGIAKTLAATKNYKNAIVLLKELIEESKEHLYNRIYLSLDLEQENGPYDSYLCELSTYYNMVGQFDSVLVQENSHIRPSEFELAKSYNNIGNAYAGKQQWDKAILYLKKAIDKYSLHQRYRQVTKVLSNLLFCYKEKKAFDMIPSYINNILNYASRDLLSTFQELTYDERSRYVDEYANLLTQRVPIFAYYTGSDSIIVASYNALLMMKGALLASDRSVRNVIDDSKDDILREMWDKMKVNRFVLSKEIEKDSLSRKLNIDSLQRTITLLEDSIIVRCKEYGDITRNMKMKWRDIQTILHPKEIAIEFLTFPVNNDSVMYAALTVRKDSKVPKMTILFEEKQLKEVSDTLYYQCKEMVDLVWKPLQEELHGIKNIYFSPSGAIYNIGIEYLPGIENYNIYRLSSTRELVTGEKLEQRKSAVLYGGLNYNTPADSTNTAKNLALLEETFKERANVISLDVRGSKEYLKHTKVEVDRIGDELRNAEWVCLLDTAALGTEESFKALSGRRIGCLHISTHGFYYTKKEADNARYQFFLFNDNMVSAEDKALTRSGLLLSGANHVLERETIPDNVEDGILTAREIADVDLRGLDLVVLSACQTGLGDLAQGEGVFGLQRGFKKAGANTILMSLWKVDDEATQILMTQFYKNYVSGQTKRQSLLSAQKYLKEYRKGKYKEPKYWAAFILLDAKE